MQFHHTNTNAYSIIQFKNIRKTININSYNYKWHIPTPCCAFFGGNEIGCRWRSRSFNTSAVLLRWIMNAVEWHRSTNRREQIKHKRYIYCVYKIAFWATPWKICFKTGTVLPFMLFKYNTFIIYPMFFT